MMATLGLNILCSLSSRSMPAPRNGHAFVSDSVTEHTLLKLSARKLFITNLSIISCSKQLQFILFGSFGDAYSNEFFVFLVKVRKSSDFCVVRCVHSSVYIRLTVLLTSIALRHVHWYYVTLHYVTTHTVFQVFKISSSLLSFCGDIG